jgi:hypothetical protein
LQYLANAGWSRDSVDVAVCTRLHVDHVGWNTMPETLSVGGGRNRRRSWDARGALEIYAASFCVSEADTRTGMSRNIWAGPRSRWRGAAIWDSPACVLPAQGKSLQAEQIML